MAFFKISWLSYRIMKQRFSRSLEVKLFQFDELTGKANTLSQKLDGLDSNRTVICIDVGDHGTDVHGSKRTLDQSLNKCGRNWGVTVDGPLIEKIRNEFNILPYTIGKEYPHIEFDIL